MMANSITTYTAVENAPKAVGPYSLAVKAGNLIITSGQLGLDAETGMLVEGGIQAQMEKALQNLAAILHSANSSLAKVIKTTVFLKNMDDFNAMNEVYERFFKETLPARSAVGVAALPKGGLVEIEAIAVQE